MKTPQVRKSRPSFGGFLQSPFANTPRASAHSTPRGTPLRMSSEDRKRSFEEWLKISADNKINGQNTWELALIDYFADMSLLREGDSINFQKASHTLDGCVKVYSSRIDSVDQETRQLLLGLADNKAEPENEVVEGETSKKRRTTAKTLSDSKSLSMEDLEIDFAQDPLFQKTAADFDQGGANGLLLANLDISSDGRIIFDATDYVQTDADHINGTDWSCDVGSLQAKFGARLDYIRNQVICPTFKDFLFNSDVVKEDFAMSIDNRKDFYYEPADLSDVHSIGDDYPIENDIHEFSNDPDNVFNNSQNITTKTELKEESIMKMIRSTVITEENKFVYFDSIKGSSWVGPNHWRARIIKDASKEKILRPKKTLIPIQFTGTPILDKNQIMAPSKTSTLLPKTTLNKRELNLLPTDMKFNSSRFTKMFLRPEYSMKEFSEKIVQQVPDYNSRQEDTLNDIGYEQIGGFDDDDHGDELEFPITLTLPDQEPLDYGALLSQQPKPSTSEPLVFSKKAKRVDVQKLKENLWSKLAENSSEKPKAVDMDDDKTIFEEEIHCEKTFTKVIKELDSCYEEKPRKDISVAFCFICVLHLANENNLSIQGSESMKELIIRN